MTRTQIYLPTSIIRSRTFFFPPAWSKRYFTAAQSRRKTYDKLPHELEKHCVTCVHEGKVEQI